MRKPLTEAAHQQIVCAVNPDASSTSESPRGVEHAGVIDLLIHHEREGKVTLVMVETRPWDGSQRQLFQLQEKLNAYLSFALDGEMADAYPTLAGKPLGLRLECATYPDDAVVEMLEKVREQIAFQGIDLEVIVKNSGR